MRENSIKLNEIISQEEEMKLFSLVKEGNGSAVYQLYIKYRPAIDYALRKYSFMMEPFVDPYEYEAACVDALLNCIKNFDMRPSVKFISYLQTSLERAIKRVVYKYHANGREQIKNTISLEENVINNLSDGSTEIGSRYEYVSDGSYEEKQYNSDNELLVEKLLTLFPKRFVDVFKLYANGTTIQEIARKYNVSHTNIGSMIKDAQNFINTCRKLGWQVKTRVDNNISLIEIASELNITYNQAKYYMAVYDYLYGFGKKPGKKPKGVWKPFDDWSKGSESPQDDFQQ